MAKIIKAHAGNAPRLDGETGEYEWVNDGDTVDVDPVTAEVLLRIDGFSEVADPREVKKAEKVVADPAPTEPPTFTGPQAVTEPAPAPASVPALSQAAAVAAPPVEAPAAG